jgi:hypothetical protein
LPDSAGAWVVLMFRVEWLALSTLERALDAATDRLAEGVPRSPMVERAEVVVSEDALAAAADETRSLGLLGVARPRLW